MIAIDESIEQMHRGQDQTYSGIFVDSETGEKGQYGLVTDGHGNDKCIECLRSIPREILNDIIGSKYPVQNLGDYINKNIILSIYESSGATMCLVKVYIDRIVVINCGDSQAAVYKNGETVFISEEHNCYNEKEQKRLETLVGITYIDSNNIEVVNETKLCGTKSTYAVFPPHLCLACTQAIGHNGRTGFAPETTVIPFESDDTIQVVIGSDGFWDMVIKKNNLEINSFASKSSEELVKFAVNRWLQQWNMHKDKSTEDFVIDSYDRDSCDDVCVVKINITPRKNVS